MDLQIIDTLFTCGKFAALTPSSTKNTNPHWSQKLYSTSVFLVNFIAFIVSTCDSTLNYHLLTSMQFVLATLFELNQFCFLFYVLIVVMILRRSRWFRLIESLATVQAAPQRIPVKMVFVVPQVVYCCLAAFGFYAVFQHFSFLYLVFSVLECYHHFTQFFYIVVTSTFLVLLLSRYERLRETLSQARSQLHAKQIVATLKTVKSGVFALKEGVEDFNDIFGWAILFNIFSCVSRTLVYIDLIVKKSNTWLTQGHLLFYYDICFVLMTWTGIVSAILLCDSILKKGDEIVAQAYRLETRLSSKENEEIQVFIDVVLHNCPEFRAARFFSIDRATLFSVLNSLTTFLLVIIQFKEL